MQENNDKALVFRMSERFWHLLGEDHEARRKAVAQLLAGWDGEVLPHALRPEWVARKKLTVHLHASIIEKLEAIQQQHKASRSLMLASAYLQYLTQATALLHRYFLEQVPALSFFAQAEKPAPTEPANVAVPAQKATPEDEAASTPTPAPVSATPEAEAEPLFFQNRSPYTDGQMQKLYQAVLELRRQATASLQANSTLRAVQEGSDDADIAATRLENDQIEWSNRKAAQLLAECESALQRMISGEYGWCETTGEEIPLERMLANPLARYTIEAQERIERRQALGGR